MTWQAELQQHLCDARKVVVLGAGSVLCGDDGAGMLVVEHLQKALADRANGEEKLLPLAGSTAPENFSGVIRAYCPDLILLVDAAFMEAGAGEIRFLDPAQIKGINFSTHMLPLSVLVDYLHQETAASVAVIGIQPQATEFDTLPGEAVCQACEALAAEIVKNIF